MSYTLKYTGQEIDDILDRANEGGALDVAIAAEKTRAEAAEALKAPIASPAFTGTPTAPTPAAGDDSTNVATTGFVAGEIRTEASSRDAAIEDAISEEVTARNEAIEAAQQEAIDEAVAEALAQALPTDTASGSIASFPDGAENVPVKELTAEIESIQDLHGQSNPYPEGGGKNKLPLTVSGIKAANSSLTWTGNSTVKNDVTFTILTDSANNVIGVRANGTASVQTDFNLALDLPAVTYILNGCPSGGGSSAYRLVAQHSGSADVDTGSGVTTNGAAITSLFIRISGSYYASNITFYPMLRLSTEADATFAPYSNICPISGWTGAEISVTGANLWDGEYEAGTYDTTTGEKSSASENTANRTKNKIKVIPSTSVYHLGGLKRVFYYDENEVYLTNAVTASDKGIISIPYNAHYITFQLNNSYNMGAVGINYPSTVTKYKPFGTTYSVSWADEAGTVYKGNLNATTGVLTVAWKGVDLGTADWIAPTNPNKYILRVLDSMYPTAESQVPNFIKSSVYKVISYNTYVANNLGMCLYNAKVGPTIGVYDPAYTTLADFKTAMNGQTVIYQLATPITYQLTPTEVQTLLGNNNMWSNTGDISVRYRANTALYIEKKLGGGTQLSAVSTLSIKKPTTITAEDLEQGAEVNDAVTEAIEAGAQGEEPEAAEEPAGEVSEEVSAEPEPVEAEAVPEEPEAEQPAETTEAAEEPAEV